MYKIIINNGKPFEEIARDETELKAILLKYKPTEEDAYTDLKVYDNNNNDITESQFINEMIEEINEVD